MSYPGHPYQQGSAPGAPYPPCGGVRYPSQSLPYPAGGLPANPNSFGFNSSTPMQMPQPMQMPSYPAPTTGGGYPSATNAGYPTASGGYPPVAGGYPPSAGGYPPNSGGYPPTSGGYPSTSVSYPPISGNHLPGSTGYPPSSNQPHPRSFYPPIPGPASNSTGNYGASNVQGHICGFPYTQHNNEMTQGSYKPLKSTPTVFPANPFNPRSDAEVLKKAMKGFGTDEKAIINVLARRSNAQRLQIAADFKTLYGKDLISDLRSELSGNFEKLIVAMITPLPAFYAKELHDAMSGIGTDEDVLIDTLCTMSNSEIRTIREAYHSMYYRSLESDLKGDTGGTFKRLMVSLCNACRDESMITNPQQAVADVQSLLRAGELRLGTDESTFNMVLCQRNYAQLQLIFQEYQRITGHDIEEAIKNEFSGDSEDGFLAVIRSIKNKAGFFAKRLNKSMKGLGTNDRQLIRLVVARSEVDMVEIKREYQNLFRESLGDAIKGDCSGHYKKCLLALIGDWS